MASSKKYSLSGYRQNFKILKRKQDTAKDGTNLNDFDFEDYDENKPEADTEYDVPCENRNLKNTQNIPPPLWTAGKHFTRNGLE